MINNRQGGRRRGRGGQRVQNLGGQPGNRQDNRQRGNAAQLLEKYKSMARDAQLAGDRVQTEYYLQFADHYYRVLGESRARFEEQRRQRGDDGDEEEMDEELIEAEGDAQGGDAAEEERPQRRERFDPADRGDRGDRRERGRRFAREDGDGERDTRNGADRGTGNGSGGDGEGIPFDVLPPAIGRDAVDEPQGEEEEAPRPRRRRLRPRAAEGEGEIAPAA